MKIPQYLAAIRDARANHARSSINGGKVNMVVTFGEMMLRLSTQRFERLTDLIFGCELRRKRSQCGYGSCWFWYALCG